MTLEKRHYSINNLGNIMGFVDTEDSNKIYFKHEQM